MSMIGADPWFVAQTQVNAEARAARNLLRQGFEIYWPRSHESPHFQMTP
jgi:transcriptional antiterminator RfaH